MSEEFDAVIIGAGPGGEVVADELIDAGRRVAMVERELVGGECPYWACIPSKALLRPGEAQGEARRAFGVSTPALDWKDTAAYRDWIVRGLDDAGSVKAYEGKGATIVRGTGRIAGPGRVDVDGRVLEAEHVIVATGSSSNVPPIEGLEDVPYWTNREATTLAEVPDRVMLVGGGPVAVELSQVMSRFGAQVTLVQYPDRLVNREDPRVGELIEAALRDDGIDVRTGVGAESARTAGGPEGTTVVGLSDGSEVEVDRLVIAAGRTPRIHDIGLETVGVEPGARSLPIDEGCRLAEGLWAVGDATGVAMFTHLAQYQGRVAAANILGGSRRANYRAVPRVVFSDPEIAAVGLSEEAAREQGIDVATATVDLAASLARPVTYERNPRGELGVVADRARGVLVGAWAVSPLASEFIHEAVVSIRAEVGVDVLLDTVRQFPTFAEGMFKALDRLEM
ncbi:MAG: dihydrolipoyl dehydrogenase family protein [Thermoleophilaceae bacterium]|jgi:dihydrolipoamide dehydrogenase|nr:NAD(P)/FAD-dependent oxidoreductase [Thermoleophilaceae bacterium]